MIKLFFFTWERFCSNDKNFWGLPAQCKIFHNILFYKTLRSDRLFIDKKHYKVRVLFEMWLEAKSRENSSSVGCRIMIRPRRCEHTRILKYMVMVDFKIALRCRDRLWDSPEDLASWMHYARVRKYTIILFTSFIWHAMSKKDKLIDQNGYRLWFCTCLTKNKKVHTPRHVLSSLGTDGKNF